MLTCGLASREDEESEGKTEPHEDRQSRGRLHPTIIVQYTQGGQASGKMANTTSLKSLDHLSLLTKGESMMLDDLSLLSDLNRIRILRLVECEELGVGELVQILQLPQSSVSRHLKALSQADWVNKQNVGTASLVSLNPALSKPRTRLWELVRSESSEEPQAEQDLQRMKSILAQRQVDSRAFFGAVASRWSEVRRELFGDAFLAPTLAALVEPSMVIGDLGCGAGDTSAQLARYAKQVFAVDHEEAMLALASKRLGHLPNVEILNGEINALPLDDACLDSALVMLVLHHVPELLGALSEIRRVLKPGGRVVILDMTQHERESYRLRMGHMHLGFKRADIEEAASRAGLTPERYHLIPADLQARGPGLFVATFRA